MADSSQHSTDNTFERHSMFRQILTLPNQLTMLRMLILPFILIAMIYHQHGTALMLFLVAVVTDVVDGRVARHFGQKTELGSYLDPLADKLLLSSAFVVQALIGAIPWWLTILVLTRDVVILGTVLVVMLATTIRDFPPSSFGKLSTVVQAITIALVVLNNDMSLAWITAGVDILVWIVAVTTLASAADYMIRIAQQLQRNLD